MRILREVHRIVPVRVSVAALSIARAPPGIDPSRGPPDSAGADNPTNNARTGIACRLTPVVVRVAVHHHRRVLMTKPYFFLTLVAAGAPPLTPLLRL